MVLKSDPLQEGLRRIDDPGCQQLVGYETRLDARGVCEVTLDVGAQHLNRHGILHGGMVATVMDVVCGNTASQYFDPEGHGALVTVALNLSYLAPTGPGRITATARVTGGGKSTVHVIGDLQDAKGDLLATATGIFRRIRKG
ncbi:PaaI family thioesterase [Phaeobacter sp. B1627]|uniref:PaaI family thioesterase n=1 Tax=Phaeobacter sp. B1627 TaxID=2583809 RepID=UPI00111BCA45|nr:PaaI family thioesterase [Phaeobacter sp. B1627]TNJ47714.1 PaaI family thioesterase [Phaeobacter sp. B1627]